MNFDESIKESFGQSSHLDIDDLRRLYYGRPDIFIHFTNDASIDVDHDELPEGIICYDVRDVVGRKVQASEFYALVMRMNKSGRRFIDDVRRYRKADFDNDMVILKTIGWIDEIELDALIRAARASTKHRFEFQRLWEITRRMAYSIASNDLGGMWREILISLGYVGFSDPSRTAVLGARELRTLYIDYERREDLDILPIQKYRKDPRRRTEDQVERSRSKMRGARNRVSKKRT